MKRRDGVKVLWCFTHLVCCLENLFLYTVCIVIAYSTICTLKASLNLTNECLPRGEGRRGEEKEEGEGGKEEE